MNKKYDYDAIMKLAGEGGLLDQKMAVLQEKLKNLRVAIENCEESFHGSGGVNASSICASYDKLLQSVIGKTSTVGSYWWTTNNVNLLSRYIYSNAEKDKLSDSEA